MDKLNFHFAIHCHQPVGNFDGVFREAFEKSYKPLIKALLRHPAIKFGLHISGPVWDWVGTNEPAFISDIERLVDRGQVELISGGYYEPILEILTGQDASGQIEMMNKFIRTRFKQNPKGIWLAERVWDPSLPSLLAGLGIKYTTIDDTHFYYAGLEEKDIHGFYVTERAGHPLNIFPIQKKLRYAIPFKEPSQVIDILKAYRDTGTINSVTYADDGEKFGLWPGTYKWVFEQGWLERFFGELEKNAGWLGVTTQGDEISVNSPTGRIYIPSASYEEMLEWALPVEAEIRFKAFKSSVSAMGIDTSSNPYIRGGFWDNFLVKYPESNWMHKRMLLVSTLLSTTENRIGVQMDDARLELFKSQSNCVYWHGLFGGVYLNYLRHAVYEHLLKAEALIDAHKPQQPHIVTRISQDIDLDGKDEIILKNNHLSLYLAPAKGGALVEIDIRDNHFNITNVMTRRKEAYHELIIAKQAHRPSASSPVTIHNMVEVKEDALEQKLIYDWHPRYSFVEHFLPSNVLELDKLYKNQYTDIGDFTLERHTVVKQEGNTVFLSRDGHLTMNSGDVISLRMEKSFRLLEKRMEAGYRLTNTSGRPISIAMLIELNLTLLGTDDQRSIVINRTDEKASSNAPTHPLDGCPAPFTKDNAPTHPLDGYPAPFTKDNAPTHPLDGYPAPFTKDNAPLPPFTKGGIGGITADRSDSGITADRLEGGKRAEIPVELKKEIKGMADYLEYGRIDSLELIDKWQKLGIKISTSSIASLFTYPIETVSASEGGFERTYQGTCFLLVYDLNLTPGESRGITIPLDFYSVRNPGDKDDIRD